jgi:small subunit ribosomal protein S2
MSKREKLQITRQRAKLDKNLGSIADLTRLPAAMFIVDISKEHIALKEANRLNIPVFGMVDTNSDPNSVDFPIPANDDASKSISLIIDKVCDAIQEGLEERKMEKEKENASKEKDKAEKGESRSRTAKKTSAKKSEAETEKVAEAIGETKDKDNKTKE